MFFFQDNIGVLILMARLPFWQWVFTPVAEHFEPVTNALLYLEYKLFHLQFYHYLGVSVLLHMLNCILLYKLAKHIFRKRFYAVASSLLFLVNQTFTEPILWSLLGLFISTFSIGTAFLFWFKFMEKNRQSHFYVSLLFILIAGLSYGLGVGLGVIFGFSTIIYHRKYLSPGKIFYPVTYFFTGIFTFILGPLLSSGIISAITPRLTGTLKDIWLYPAFVIAGVARGVIGRLFLPGFEPRHFEIIATAISFIPALVIGVLIFWYLKNAKNRIRGKIIPILMLFVLFPYLWAGFVRFHFGLKQALAERYAYPSLFFFALILSFLFKWLQGKKVIRQSYIIIYILAIFLGQTVFFVRNAIIFEERPRQTKEYFDNTRTLLKENGFILNLPLPSYINQEFFISDIAPLLIKDMEINYLQPKEDFCTEKFISSLSVRQTYNYYMDQAKDSVVGKVINGKMIDDCKTYGKLF